MQMNNEYRFVNICVSQGRLIYVNGLEPLEISKSYLYVN
jgi:hypothetical protein